MITNNGDGDLSTSLAKSINGRGHVARIGSRPTEEFERPTFAAGAVLWRRNEQGELEIAVEHRPRYDDWTLPKGKVDPGENLAGTAFREILEETGYRVELGWLLGYVHYPVRKRTKVVYYWTAEAVDGYFEGNDDVDDEVDELRWLSPKKARKSLTYPLDQQVLDAALELLALGANRRVLLTRHARALPRRTWSGDDDKRILDKRGRRQSEMLVSQLGAYGPSAVFSARPDRCFDTVSPLSQAFDLPLTVSSTFSDDQVVADVPAAVAALKATVEQRKVAAVSSQGAAIPAMLEHLFSESGVEVEDVRVKKGSVWVLHFKDDQLLGADYLASALPVK